MLAEIRARLSLPTPAFWKKLQKRTAAASASFAALTVTVASIQNHLPNILPTILGGCAAFLGGISSVCSLAVDDPTVLVAVAPPPPAEPASGTTPETS